jgi:hypothetical protein
VDLLTPAAMRGVIDREVQIGAVGDQIGQDQIERGQADLINRPAGGREEPMRPIMRPRRGQPSPGQHPAHRALPGLRDQPEDHRLEHRERGRRETPSEDVQHRRNEIGNMTPGSIDGSLSATTVVQGPSMLPSSHPKITQLQVNPACHTHRRLTTKTAKLQGVCGAPLLAVSGV